MNDLYSRNLRYEIFTRQYALQRYGSRYKKIKKCLFYINVYSVELWTLIYKERIYYGKNYRYILEKRKFYVVNGPEEIVIQQIVLPDWDTAERVAFSIGDGEYFSVNNNTIVAESYGLRADGMPCTYIVDINIIQGYNGRLL